MHELVLQLPPQGFDSVRGGYIETKTGAFCGTTLGRREGRSWGISSVRWRRYYAFVPISY